MNYYLTMNNAYVKTHNSYLSEVQPPPRNLLLSENRTTQVTENNNQITSTNGTDKTIQEVWSKYKFETNNSLPLEVANCNKTTWATEITATTKEDEEVKVEDEEEEEEASPKEKEEEESSPSHHARRPMNAFLIFCKKHRPIVRERYPNLENRGVTRILGEWWALLDENDKAPYTGLAKEYKDAFLSANPNFKWYKLPAPPLRTLNVRPTSTHKVQSPVSSPTHNFSMESEFTPGKLADESQLGSLTSLMNNNNFSPSKIVRSNENNNNNVEKNGDQEYDASLKTPVNSIKTSLPPKPFKKRTFDKYPDNNNRVARSLPLDDISSEDQDGSMTNQDLMDKVVDKIFTNKSDLDYDSNGLRKEVRKSGRQCKGKRYEKFMVEGRLLGNKRDAKLTSQRSIENELNMKLENKPEPETPNLDHTIKRLAERTNMKSVFESQKSEEKNERIRSNESHAHDANTNFDLNQRINELPSLSYDVFHQRKKESKKRKNRIRTDSESKSKVAKLAKSETQPVGSKKRKNKQSITHLKEDSGLGSELLALATLAEVAANTEKINSE